MNPDIVRIMRGEGATIQLSDREREILSFVLNLCGEQLSGFFLTGLGEYTTSWRRRFTVTFAPPAGVLYEREIKVIAYQTGGVSKPSLPRLKEPLIMAALLRLLIDERKMSSFTMTYRQEEVLGMLGWDVTEETREALDDSVRRYDSLHYEWALSKDELAVEALDFYEGQARVISGYAYENAEVEGEMHRVRSEVRYAEEFVRELIGRSLFGVNWDGVVSLKYIDY